MVREAPTPLLLTEWGRPLDRQHVPSLINGRKRGNRQPRGPDYLLPLKIRQSVIAGLLAAGHDVRVVQAFAGHRNPSTTEHYRTTALEELAAAIWRLHPRQ